MSLAPDTPASHAPTASAPIIVIGAGLAGWTTVRELRKLDTATPVILITADSGDFYAKPSLSNAFGQQRAPEQLVTTPAAKMVETLKVTLLQHTRVVGLDTAARTVRTSTGEFAYRSLVLATGARPIRVPVQGNAAAEVLSVNSLQDFSVFHARMVDPGNAAHEGRRVVIMGAGLIGSEFANDLAIAGHTVHVVDPAARPLAALLPEAASTQLQAALAPLGVNWHFGQTVAAVDRAEPASALRVTLSGGSTLTADVVLSAIGLRADTALAQAAGLHCDRGIIVDTRLQTSTPDVYALGDNAQYQSAGQRTLPYVMPIMHAARALAATLAGQPTELTFPLMPVAVKTPALPLVVAAPTSGTPGDWHAMEACEWRWLDDTGALRGFVLAGAATPRRARLAAAVSP